MFESLSDAEDLSDAVVHPIVPLSPLLVEKPKLAFRVWDSNFQTKYTEAGFESEAHLLWDGDYMATPFPNTEDGRRAQAFLTNIHLSKEGKSMFCYYA